MNKINISRIFSEFTLVALFAVFICINWAVAGGCGPLNSNFSNAGAVDDNLEELWGKLGAVFEYPDLDKLEEIGDAVAEARKLRVFGKNMLRYEQLGVSLSLIEGYIRCDREMIADTMAAYDAFLNDEPVPPFYDFTDIAKMLVFDISSSMSIVSQIVDKYEHEEGVYDFTKLDKLFNSIWHIGEVFQGLCFCPKEELGGFWDRANSAIVSYKHAVDEFSDDEYNVRYRDVCCDIAESFGFNGDLLGMDHVFEFLDSTYLILSTLLDEDVRRELDREEEEKSDSDSDSDYIYEYKEEEKANS